MIRRSPQKRFGIGRPAMIGMAILLLALSYAPLAWGGVPKVVVCENFGAIT